MPATCTTAGKTAGSHCSVCNTVLKAQEATPALKHNYQVTLKKPSFTENGYTLHKCSRCEGSYKTDEVPKLNAAEVAKDIMTSFGSTPEVFDFLPEAFSKENLAGSNFEPDYGKGVSVSAIPAKYFGKQLNMIYGTLYNAQDVLGYVDTVYRAADGIAALYIQYLNTNPENTAHFEGTYGGFSFVLDIQDSGNRLTAAFGTKVAITLTTSDNGCTGEVRIAGGNVLKYENKENYLKLAVSIFGTGMVQLEFIRDEKSGNVAGYLYEYLTVAGKDVMAASAMLTVDNNYVTVAGTKGDFCSPSKENRNVEIYSAKTAQLLISSVYEDVEYSGVGTQYYTYWVPINNLSGINSIRRTDEKNGKNNFTIYINGSANPFEVKYNEYKIPIVGKVIQPSRWFDIEFKTVYSYRVNEEGKMEKFSYEIPMFFVQKDHVSDFAAELYRLNTATLSAKPVLSTGKKDITCADEAYTVTIPAYNQIKDSVTREIIAAYLGVSSKEDN